MARKPVGLVPALRPDLTLSAEEADLSSAAVDAFTVAIGGRAELLNSLLVADGTPEIHKIVNLLIDPRYGGWSLRQICALGGLTIADLFAAYRKALLVRAHLQATKTVVDQLPAVVADIMERSRPYEVTCESCRGLGTVTPEPTKAVPNPTPGPCVPCRGAGRLLQQPDLDRQKVALELGQLIQQRGGINIQQNSLTLPAAGGGSGAPGPLEQLQQAVHEVLYPRARTPEVEATRPPVVDGAIVDAEEATT